MMFKYTEQMVLKMNYKNTYPERTGNCSYSFIDLFAGIGGMRIGFERAGCSCVFSSEINPKSRETYEANFQEKPFGDITQIEPRDIPDHDILVGGFPCQPFSLAGVSKKNSLNRPTGFLDETQGTLFFNICSILKEKRPKAFLLENVKNLISHDKKKTFAVIGQCLKELDYDFSWKVIDGQAYVPQHRERIFIVGFDKRRYGENVDFQFSLNPPENKPVLKDILEPNVEEKYTLSDKLWDYLQQYKLRQKAKGNGFGYSLANPEGISRTLSARYHKDGAEILIAQNETNPRRLTPRECARLQGFPEDFIIPVSDTAAYHQFGNSVVVPLVENMAELIVKKLDELDESQELSRPDAVLKELN